jgi:hypothetical protein
MSNDKATDRKVFLGKSISIAKITEIDDLEMKHVIVVDIQLELPSQKDFSISDINQPTLESNLLK